MSVRKNARAEKLQTAFNDAAMRAGLLGMFDMLTDKQFRTLDKLHDGIAAIEAAQKKLKDGTLVKKLDTSAGLLKAEFIREVKGIVKSLPNPLKDHAPKTKRQPR